MSLYEPDSCIERCHHCRQTCLDLVSHCLGQGGAHAKREHIVMLLDCADICGTCAGFQSRRSGSVRPLSSLCADLCDDCAEECEAFDDDQEMARAAETCRRCAESCRAMVRNYAEGA